MKSTTDLSIILHPHPTLRYQTRPLRRFDARLKEVIGRMFELMYEHRGVGLAATQVGLPLRLFVMNSTGRKGEGQEVTMINPVISRPRANEIGEEGCLSLPNIHGNVIRAKTIRVNAFTLNGEEINQDFSGYEARIIQHETDHLDGKMFIDRLKEDDLAEKIDELDSLKSFFESQQRAGVIADNAALQAELLEWERLYC